MCMMKCGTAGVTNQFGRVQGAKIFEWIVSAGIDVGRIYTVAT